MSKVESTNKSKEYLALIVDDQPAIRDSLAGVIKDEGWSVYCVSSGQAAIDYLKVSRADVVFMDVWMPKMDGIEALQKIREQATETPIVIMSGHAKIETAVRATKYGALDFLEKPLTLDSIVNILVKAKQNSQQGSIDSKYSLLGSSKKIIEIKEQLRKLSSHDASVLITGENGTGKEVVARLTHKQSPRSEKKFIAVNCAAIPEELIESELFGHKKGAFTSAIADKEGKFELANGGTLFLDEIGDMSLKTQAKILRVLETQELQKIGSNDQLKVDVRIIAATNKDLSQEIARGHFREDLYYRLNVVPIHVPPLRERSEDVAVFVDFFSSSLAARTSEQTKVFSDKVMEVFRRYSWPGNVRELKNLIERVYILCGKELVSLIDLPDEYQNPESLIDRGILAEGEDLKSAKNNFEKTFLLKKLRENSWNISKTAEAIGLERSNLHRKIKAYNIEFKDDK